MFVVFLHGPPAAGKHTVGTRLAALLGVPLFHNHLTVDLASALFEFGSPGFVQLRSAIWVAAFEAAAAQARSFIFTFNPERTVDPTLIVQLESLIEARAGRMYYVRLSCSEAQIERRLGAESRAAFGKLRDVMRYRAIREAGGFEFPQLPGPLLNIATDDVEPQAAAAAIARAVTAVERTQAPQ